MANIITFSFKSDAPWSENELDNLNSALAEVVQDMDDDHVEGSFNTNIADEAESKSQITDEQKQEIIEELLGKATISGTVTVSIDGENALQAEVNLI
jgi:hypothetical protein